MTFKGYNEQKRGNWFNTQVLTNFWSDEKDVEIYLINEQDGYFTRVRDEKQMEVLSHMFCCGLEDEKIEWLKMEAGFRYFDSVDDLIAFEKEEVNNILKYK